MESTVMNVRAMLADAAISRVKAGEAVQKAQEKAKGAYTLFVEAGILAGTPAVLSEASDALFTEIREGGKVVGSDGKKHGIGAKPNKDGTGYLVPSAISAAKSYILDAMVYGFSLVGDDGQPRAFGAIRAEVMARKDEEKRKTAEGDDALRYRAHDLLAMLSDWVRERKGEALQRTVTALEGAIKAQASKTEKAETKGEAIAKAA